MSKRGSLRLVSCPTSAMDTAVAIAPGCSTMPVCSYRSASRPADVGAPQRTLAILNVMIEPTRQRLRPSSRRGSRRRE
jgi:hypothetical protein